MLYILGVLISFVLSVISVYVVFLFLMRLYIKKTSGWCRSKRSMDGKTVIITGGNAGIGKESALDLARRNARVILACRSMERGEKAVQDIINETGNNNVIAMPCDLSDMDSVRRFAQKILETEDRLDVLINNAAMAPGKGRHLTKAGLEIQFATNHLGPFLLTNLLLELLKKSAPSRIVNVSSLGHKFGEIDFDNLNFEKKILHPFWSYCRTKLANVLFTKELARQLVGTNVTANSLHPGNIRTEISRNAAWWYKAIVTDTIYRFQKTAKEGAQTTIHLAVCEEVEGISGEYFSDCAIAKPHSLANNEEVCKKLWDISAELVGLDYVQETVRRNGRKLV